MTDGTSTLDPIGDTRLPLVLPPTVQRTTDGGLPTKELLDWEELTRDWYKSAASTLQSNLYNLESLTGANYAQVTRDITSLTSDTEALARDSETLTAIVGQNEATAHQEVLTYAGPTSALAQTYTSLNAEIVGARFGSPSLAAQVSVLNQARIDGDVAQAKTSTDLNAKVDANYTASIATAHNELLTYVGPDGATSRAITDLNAKVDINYTASAANAHNELLAYVGPAGATSQSIANLNVKVDNNFTSQAASIGVVNQARIDGDNVISQSVTNLNTKVDNNFGSQQASLNVLFGSYNGLAVKFGVYGNINGQTGSFEFGGIQRNDGSVVYTTVFNSNVIINGGLLINGSVDFLGLAANSVTNSFGANGYTAGTIFADGTARTAGRLIIVATVSHTEGTFRQIGNNTSYVPRVYPVFLDGQQVGAVQSTDVLTGSQFVSGSAYNFYGVVAPAATAIAIPYVAAGGHRISIDNATGQAVELAIVGTFFAR